MNSSLPINQTDTQHWSKWLALLLVFCIAIWFTTLGTRRLLNPDEGRYAEIAREMLVTGDWITPRLNGIKYFEKPPLQYWMTATAYTVLGQNEFAARLWVGLCGFAGILFAGFTGWRCFGRDAGLMAAAVLGSSLLYVVVGHLNTLDMGLSFFLQLAVCSFVLAQHTPQQSRSERNWMLVAWCAAGLAFLTKGLIAFVLPSLCLLAYTVICREYSAWRRLHAGLGLPLLLLICAPWLIAVSLHNPEFPRFFFWHEQFERFLVDSHDRDGPWWYFLPLFVVGTLPWLLIGIRQTAKSWHSDQAGAGFKPRRFLLLWVVVVVGFFSASHSKLPPYIVPALPMFALLIGDRLTQLPVRALQRHWQAMGVILLLIALAIALLPDAVVNAKNIDLVHDLRPETSIGFAIIGVTLSWVSWYEVRQQAMLPAVLTTALGTLLGLTILTQGSDALRVTRSGYDIAQELKPLLREDTRLFSVSDYDQTLPFYLHRTMTLVDYRGELDFGLTQQPELALDTIAEFEQAWRQQSSALAIVTPSRYTQLQNAGLPMQLVAQHAKWLAIRKP